ncbi:ELMO domain-containing protein 1-like isoform X4 [Artemia franciscana]
MFKKFNFTGLLFIQWTWMELRLWVQRVVKWNLRKITGLCELQRIAYGETPGAARSSNIERSLMMSRSSEIQKLISYLDRAANEGRFSATKSSNDLIISKAVKAVMQIKLIKPSVHQQFVISLEKCIQKIWSYRQLLNDLESLRTTSYNSENSEHEEKLIKLWKSLRPNEELSDRISRQWQEIGFQGDDPKTDFRGMGILGLENLLYSFAIVGINLTSMAINLFRDGSAKYHIYNTCQFGSHIETFHKFYCYLFLEFDKFWLSEKPRDVMEFGKIRDRFEKKIRVELSDLKVQFKLNVAVETI